MDIADEAAPIESEGLRLIRDLEHQIEHLARSNRELEAFMQENGDQKELRTAVGENIVTIARRRAVLADMRKQLGLQASPPSVQMEECVADHAAASVSSSEQPVEADPSSGVYL